MTDIGISAVVLVGTAVIVHPPIVGGKAIEPPPGEFSYTFTQPVTPCDGPDCQQELVRMEKDPNACWMYENMSLGNVEKVPPKFRIERAPERILILAVGD